MKEGLMFIYRVKHPECGEIEVEAADRLRAICAAANTWGVRWTDIARTCECERLRRVPEKKKAPPRKRMDGRGL